MPLLGGSGLRRTIFQQVAGLAVKSFADCVEGAETDTFGLPRLEY